MSTATVRRGSSPAFSPTVVASSPSGATRQSAFAAGLSFVSSCHPALSTSLRSSVRHDTSAATIATGTRFPCAAGRAGGGTSLPSRYS